jgi:hypothetical protein
MEAPVIYGIICLIFIWLNLYISTQIVSYLKKHGYDASLFTNGFYVRGKIFKYLPAYKETTNKLEGKIGSLYAMFYFSFMGLCFFLLMGLLNL